MATNLISVAVLDSQPLYRDALVGLIDKHHAMRVAGTAPPTKEAISMIAREHPRVCVLDYDLPEREGHELIRSMCECTPAPRVLVLAGTSQLDGAYAIIEAGAAGCLMKSADGEEIVETICRLAKGEGVFHPEIQTMIAGHIRGHARHHRNSISEREREILCLTAEGLSAHEIGETLNLAESTVKTHLTRIYGKLGVSERAAAVAEALRSGLIN